MKEIIGVPLAILSSIVALAVIPAIVILCGGYTVQEFFNLAPYAKIDAIHYDFDAYDAEGDKSMRITATIETHELKESTIEMWVEIYYYWDNTPVLSLVDKRPMKGSKKIKVTEDHTPMTESLEIDYRVFPNECKDKTLKIKTYLVYINKLGEKETGDEETTAFKVYS